MADMTPIGLRIRQLQDELKLMASVMPTDKTIARTAEIKDELLALMDARLRAADRLYHAVYEMQKTLRHMIEDWHKSGEL